MSAPDSDVPHYLGAGPGHSVVLVSGTTEALMMAAAGRRAALAELSGPGPDVLRSRLED